MPLNYVLRKCAGSYKFLKSQEEINHLIFLNDIKIFVKKGKRTGDLDPNNKSIQPGYRNGISIEKCDILITKSGQRESAEGIELPNQEITKAL